MILESSGEAVGTWMIYPNFYGLPPEFLGYRCRRIRPFGTKSLCYLIPGHKYPGFITVRISGRDFLHKHQHCQTKKRPQSEGRVLRSLP